MQYALRTGKPHADVLIYYPFLDVGEGTLDNKEEIMTKGYLKDVEGPLQSAKEDINSAKIAWAQKLFPLINQLEAHGITWAWVNDASIQAATLAKDGGLNIRGNHFQGLILANDSIIQLTTAQAINTLASKGMNFMATGTLPSRQPSFLNWKENDKRTGQLITAALKAKTSKNIQDENELESWIKKAASTGNI